jgi:diacylglycerol kinase (ATP)
MGRVMAEQGVSGRQRIINAIGFSYAGLISTFKNEAVSRQQLVLTVILMPVARWLDQGIVEKVLLISFLLPVLIVELIKSAIESAIDRIGIEQHELSARAKDTASAAVFLALLNAFFIWLSILIFVWFDKFMNTYSDSQSTRCTIDRSSLRPV